jgi:hypothetical protein
MYNHPRARVEKLRHMLRAFLGGGAGEQFADSILKI